MAVPPQVYNLGNACKKFLFSAEVIGMLTLTIFENELTIFIGIRLLIETIAAGYFYVQCSDSAGEPVVEQEDHELSQLSFSSIRGDYEQFESQTPDRNECAEQQNIVLSVRNVYQNMIIIVFGLEDVQVNQIIECIGCFYFFNVYYVQMDYFSLISNFLFIPHMMKNLEMMNTNINTLLFCQLQQHLLDLEFLQVLYFYIVEICYQ